MFQTCLCSMLVAFVQSAQINLSGFNDSLLKGTGVPTQTFCRHTHNVVSTAPLTPTILYPLPPLFNIHASHRRPSSSLYSRIHQVSDSTQHGFNVLSIRSALGLSQRNGIVLPFLPPRWEHRRGGGTGGVGRCCRKLD